MRTSFYKLTLPVILLSVTSYSQTLIQKIYPPDPTTASVFGGSVSKFPGHTSMHKSMDQDENTLIVSDANAFRMESSGCVQGHGIVMIYKKNAGKNWILNQTIISASNDTVRFGLDIDFHGNFLAVLSADELSPSGFKTGAVNVYKRADANSEFVFLTKIFGDEPFMGTTQNFNSVAINSNYLAISVSNLIKVYKIGPTSIVPHRTFTGTSYAPSKIKMTDNNLVVGIGYDISHFSILPDTVIMTYNDRGGPYTELRNIEVDGNTIVHEYHGGKSAIQTSYVFMNWNGNSLLYSSAFSDNLTRTFAYNIELKENKWFFVTLQSSDPFGTAIGRIKINAYKYTGSEYQKAETIEQDADSSAAFGYAMSYDNNVLAVGDADDTTQVVRNTVICSERRARGAISLFSFSSVITGNPGLADDEMNAFSISPNPLRGELLTVPYSDAQLIEVLDLSGTSIRTARVTNNTCNLSGLPKGVYVVKISSGERTKTEKLIVE